MPTMGSLFDGIGGFVLAGQHQGIQTLWASEIEAFPIAVTKHHFPEMLHVGDITKLDGAKLPPVDIICGGSPCQDLSVAGRRAGLDGERSGLFMEQVRIVKEMRSATGKRNGTAHAVQPRYMCWENVPGTFSSGSPKGEDFRIVLEEILRISDSGLHVPRPPKGRWESAGVILGDQCSVAWRVLDAQYWGVPQRRRRIYLVADFGGFTAPKILFEPESLPRHLAPRCRTGQGIAAPASSGAYDTSGPRCNLKSGEDHSCMIAFACNQRDEVRNLNDIAGAVQAEPGMKQQTFIKQCLNPWATQQERVFTPNSVAPTMAGADGGGGRNPAGLIMTAGFCAGAAPTTGSIGYQEETAPTLKASESGTNMVPSILCLNDQGGQRMDLLENLTGTLRAQMDGHPPLVFENHGIDSRYTGPHPVAPTMSARYGTGGNNVPLVGAGESYCIAGNAIDRQPHNGGNGIGCQMDISYTLTSTDHHAVFSRQRTDVFKTDDTASTQSARQYKDATDLVYQQTVGTLVACDKKGPNNQYVGDDKCIIMPSNLIRRLTPLECERLQGFPDGWTDIPADGHRPGASDSARYKALGNSVAIPCVDFVLQGILYYLLQGGEKHF